MNSNRIGILVAERELDWFYNFAACKLSISAIDPASVPVGGSTYGYTDSQIAAVERSRPIWKALKMCSRYMQLVLEAAFTAYAWKDQKDHHGESKLNDYYRSYGDRLAGIVLLMDLDGSVPENRLKAQAMYDSAIEIFREHLAIIER